MLRRIFHRTGAESYYPTTLLRLRTDYTTSFEEYTDRIRRLRDIKNAWVKNLYIHERIT
jgi:hypothetical protein